MKGSALVFIACFVLFLAGPSHSRSTSEGDQLASRRDTQSESPSTDAATSGDAAKNTDTSAGENKTIKMDGDGNPGDESVAGDARAEKSKIRKRDTHSLSRSYVVIEPIPSMPLDEDLMETLFKRFGKGARCFEEVVNYVSKHGLPDNFVDNTDAETLFTQYDMINWLKFMKCLMTYVSELDSENLQRDEGTAYPPDWTLITDSSEFVLPLRDIGKTLEKCLDDAIWYLQTRSHSPGDTVQRSSGSFSDILTELTKIQSLIDRGDVRAGYPGPIPPPGGTVPPYRGSGPVMTTYKKRNSLDERRGHDHEYGAFGVNDDLAYAYDFDFNYDYQDHINPPLRTDPRLSGFWGEAIQAPYTPGVTKDMKALPAQQMTLLDIVLDNIYANLEGKVSPAVNMDAAPVEGLRVDESGASGLYPGDGKCGN